MSALPSVRYWIILYVPFTIYTVVHVIADLNFCTHTCSCVLNMSPKPYCGFVDILVVVPDGSLRVRIVIIHLFKPKNRKI